MKYKLPDYPELSNIEIPKPHERVFQAPPKNPEDGIAPTPDVKFVTEHVKNLNFAQLVELEKEMRAKTGLTPEKLFQMMSTAALQNK